MALPGALRLGRRQGLPVHLAARGEGERRERHEGGRHHGLRQPLAQALAQGLGPDVSHHVGDQAAVAGYVLARDHDRLADSRHGDEHRLDLSELDAEAPDLDLMV